MNLIEFSREDLEILIRNLLVGCTLLFLLFLIMRKKQNKEENWAIFYSTLWVFLSLLGVNWICVELGFWRFTDETPALMPYDLLFIWVILWGIIPTLLVKGKQLFIMALVLFLIDLAYMPYLDEYGILELNKGWIIGEVLMIVFVFMPAYLWSGWSLSKTHTQLRSLLQVFCMGFIYCIGIPLITLSYFPVEPNWTKWYSPYIFQLGFIIVLPALVAVIDLFEKGRGTPFPYDMTSKLVRTGVYAYIRNPIQWSLTLLFLPLAVGFSSPVLLIGIIVSLAYTFGVSNPQEHDDMEARYGEEWTYYKGAVPAWRFMWKPVAIPRGIIYFQQGCGPCSQVRTWFEKRNPIELEFRAAEDFDGDTMLQVTYYDHRGLPSTSVKAIASALEHINLAWASLAWFIRLPGIGHLLQLIVDSMGYNDQHSLSEKKDRLTSSR